MVFQPTRSLERNFRSNRMTPRNPSAAVSAASLPAKIDTTKVAAMLAAALFLCCRRRYNVENPPV